VKRLCSMRLPQSCVGARTTFLVLEVGANQPTGPQSAKPCPVGA